MHHKVRKIYTCTKNPAMSSLAAKARQKILQFALILFSNTHTHKPEARYIPLTLNYMGNLFDKPLYRDTRYYGQSVQHTFSKKMNLCSFYFYSSHFTAY